MKRKEFKESWESHIKDFSRLGWSNPDKKTWNRIKSIQEELNEIVEVLSLQYEEV